MTCYICKLPIGKRERAFYVPLPGRRYRRRSWCVRCDTEYPQAVASLLATVEQKQKRQEPASA